MSFLLLFGGKEFYFGAFGHQWYFSAGFL